MERESGKIQDCLQNETAFCKVACPFNLDVRDFIEKVQRGAFNAAYRLYLNMVGFPGIVTTLCDEPCKNACPRRETDGAISLRLLEKAAVNLTRNPNPNSYNVPVKNKKVAIIGAGVSGLACAYRLASKKYDVTVYEKSGKLGGHLWGLVQPEFFLKEFERQFIYEKYTLFLRTEITRLDDFQFDAIYIATGANGADFGLQCDPGGAFASTKPGVFMGGSLMGGTSMQAIADGLNASSAIERYIKVGSMNHPHEVRSTKLQLDPTLVTYCEPILPKDGVAFTKEEAVLEAKRCLRCSCDACYRYCDLMHFFQKYPKRIAEEVEITIHPGTLDGNGTVATRFISTCNHCGLCEEVCPINIDTGEFLLQNHRIMREKGTMPWAFHDFWLRDMEFTNSPSAQLTRIPAGHSQSQYVFFPGCQLGASEPQYVTASYQWLLTQKPDTALMLNCCGAPAEWAGDVELHNKVIAHIHEQWLCLGKPVVILACPTCKKLFERYLPELKGVFLYDLMVEWGLSPTRDGDGESISVFDPCASREEHGVQKTIRELVKLAGFDNQPLPLEKRVAACCSWGGQISIAHPRYTQAVIQARVSESDYPYIAYCSNCRDIFAAANKPVYHILDILFNLHDSNRKPPTLTARRNNRVKLKQQLLSEFWKEAAQMEPQHRKVNLHISPQVRQKLSNDMILETEVEAVIEHCESSGRKVLDSSSGHSIGHLKIGNMTYWVEYSSIAKGFEVFNAYCHRMSIEEG